MLRYILLPCLKIVWGIISKIAPLLSLAVRS
jgi:hypothetical protein